MVGIMSDIWVGMDQVSGEWGSAPGSARAPPPRTARGLTLCRPFEVTGHQPKEVLARRMCGELLTEIAGSNNVIHRKNRFTSGSIHVHLCSISFR